MHLVFLFLRKSLLLRFKSFFAYFFLEKSMELFTYKPFKDLFFGFFFREP